VPLALQLHSNAWRAGEVDVQPTIAVVVNHCDAAAHCFDDVLLLRAREVFEAYSGRFGNVSELRNRQRSGGGALNAPVLPTFA
jgi:hypothetical protein